MDNTNYIIYYYKMSYYTNGAYIIKGFKLLDKLRGEVIYTQYPSVYKKGEQVVIREAPFHKIDKPLVKLLSKMSQ